jgi:hypothetical protein
MFGEVFEAYCHSMFSAMVDFNFVPMVRIGGQPQTTGTKAPRWHSSHTEFMGPKDSATLNTLRVTALGQTASLTTRPLSVVNYNMGDVTRGLQIQTGIYYIYANRTQPSWHRLLHFA